MVPLTTVIPASDRRPALAFAGVVLVASVVPLPGEGGGGAVGLTAWFHLAGYAVLAVLLAGPCGGGRKGALLAVALATGYGARIELLQAFVPWRSFAVLDVALNAVGAATGAVALSIRSRFRGREPLD